MPFYEYRCQSCGHQVEVLQKLSDSPLACCPDCAGTEMKKLMSASADVSSQREGAGSTADAVPPCMTGGGCNGCPTN
ncbi:MAG: zinc ribbon domain-containing protein [Gammaproteobacteria bacterium]|nr:zinc ribbon domain-containing protein [Gammaproteobacteria bacterium]